MYFLRQLVIYVYYFCFNTKLFATGVIHDFDENIRIQDDQ